MYVKQRDEIKRLIDKVRAISQEEKNLKHIEYWEPLPETARDHWRGTPKPRSVLHSAPITVEPELPLWGKILGFKIDEFYTNPATYLKYQLKMMIYRYENFLDHTCIGKEIPIWLGATLESSLFGAETIYPEDESPWLDREPVIRSESDLDMLEPPDFFKSGLMPLAHQYYEVIGDLIDDDFKVTFPEWGRSPFGVATHIRGYENLLVDIVSNPKFMKQLMRFITDSRKQWTRERAKFLDLEVEKGNIYNDEVNSPTLSTAMYEEFALPYEQELSEFHGGILYWHSCGNTTDLITSIAKIPGLEMFHVGPWTNLERAYQVFDGKMPLEICVHPIQYVQKASPEKMQKNLMYIVDTCGPCPYTIRAEGLQVVNGVEEDLRKIKKWIDIANSVLKSNKIFH